MVTPHCMDTNKENLVRAGDGSAGPDDRAARKHRALEAVRMCISRYTATARSSTPTLCPLREPSALIVDDPRQRVFLCWRPGELPIGLSSGLVLLVLEGRKSMLNKLRQKDLRQPQ